MLKLTCRETLGMTLEQMGVFNLAAIRQTNVLDAKVVWGIISVAGDLAPRSRDGGDVSVEREAGRGRNGKGQKFSSHGMHFDGSQS